ncbi:hypothetical protein HWQ46_12365 [Shewanella sp. D64]|uniref:hypothetical protein n=1 Tax=unclassified Shewanella TaxID=196818 RepID=UPI0022BA3796|nr:MULTISPECIES: hypothetical protein [unclassified Shewanella]MEC4726345.1 hypothetical protein [Shewanella sp. D64]MEC4738357.1 hypothetical protein [Shewanella sp. E94]WBJ94235.1 hypothetical protein HWQ47_20420 [Shewanella sp. MTB7]
MMMLIKKIATATLSSMLVMSAAFSTLAIMPVQADADRSLSQTFACDGQQVLLDMDVGSAEVFAIDEQEIRVEVVVSHSDSSWFSLWSSSELDDVELDIDQASKQITLKLNDQDDVKQVWKIYLPREAAVTLNVGVGQVEVNNMESDVDIDLGVGHAQIKHSIIYSSVSLESGVGEVSVEDDGHAVAIDRNFVRQAYYNQDDTGFGHLSVNVGVGQIEVEHF